MLNVAAISGRVFDDLNNDGVFDVGESGLKNVRIELVREMDSTIVAYTTTTADGTYEFDFSALGIPAGTYTIRQQSQPNGYLDGKESTGDLGGAAADNGTVLNNVDSNMKMPRAQLSQRLTMREPSAEALISMFRPIPESDGSAGFVLVPVPIE